ncbi:MAG: FliM/FliN family flagellar motor switch protein [Halieaceae bacterium]
MSELLSQDEVDALLDGVEDGAVASGAGGEAIAGSNGPYDLSCNNRRLNGWQKQLGLVDDNLGKCLGHSMLGLLHKTTEVNMEGVRMLRFSDFVDGLETPTGLNSFQLEPAGGIIMVAMDAHLVYSLVESFFGGAGRRVAIQSKGFTATERRVMQLGLKTILASVKRAWKQLESQQLSLCECEHNPQASAAFAPADVVMVRRYSIKFEGGGGELGLVMSGELVETLFEAGGVQRPPTSDNSEDVMRRRASDFRATVAGEVSGASVSLKQLLNMSCGDIIPIDSPELVDVTVNGVKKFSARVGEIDGRVGLSIVDPHEVSKS